MGDIPSIYIGIVLALINLVGGLASSVLAGLILMAMRRKRDEIAGVRSDLDKIKQHLIAEGIMLPDA